MLNCVKNFNFEIIQCLRSVCSSEPCQPRTRTTQGGREGGRHANHPRCVCHGDCSRSAFTKLCCMQRSYYTRMLLCCSRRRCSCAAYAMLYTAHLAEILLVNAYVLRNRDAPDRPCANYGMGKLAKFVASLVTALLLVSKEQYG